MLLSAPRLTVHIGNLKKNYHKLCALAPKSMPAAVVKNDAYGLGAALVTRVLYGEGCRHFFVAHGVEGAAVRQAAPDADIYVLQGMGEDSIAYFQEHRLTPVISTPAEWAFWKKNKIDGAKPVIQVETGLNRLGFRRAEIEKLSAAERAEFGLILSHLSCADAQAHFMNDAQMAEFKKIRTLFPGISATLSASDGVFLGKDFQLDMVRVGAALYGINTAPYRENQMDPVVFVQAPVLQTAELKAGDYVGYGATFRATVPMRIAVVSIGYADGFVRALQGRGRVFFGNKQAPVIGRVSMDNIMVDVTEIPDAAEGDLVDVLNVSYGVDDMGRDAGTIGYEILNWIGKGQRYIRNIVE